MGKQDVLNKFELQAVDISWKGIYPQIQKGDSRTPIPLRVMASSAMELHLGVFRFLPTTHTETNANKIRPRSSCREAFHTCLSSFSDHTQLRNHGYFDHEKNLNTPNWSPMPR